MSMLRRALWGLGVGLVAGLAGSAAFADSIHTIKDPELGGTAKHSEWTNRVLTRDENPDLYNFPGSTPWSRPINADEGGVASLVFVAPGTGGGPLPIGSGLYFGGMSGATNYFGGTLAVVDASPVAGLANVVFQIQIAEAFGYDFFDQLLPTLTYNGGSDGIGASYSAITDQTQTGVFPVNGVNEPIYTNTYLLQWDLSGVAEAITQFSITFSGVQHAQIYGLRLDQSDAFTSLDPTAAVPEPASVALFCLGLTAVLYKARKPR